MRTLFDIARTAFLGGNDRAAQVLFSRLVRVAPNDPQAWFYLGAVSQRLKELIEAQQAFERVLALTPGNIDAVFALSSVKLALGDMAGALQLCRGVVTVFPDNPKAHANLGVVLEAAGEKELALESYATTLELEPTHLQAILNRGILLAELGGLDAAISCNEYLIEQHPDFIGGWLNLGHTYFQAGRYVDAHRAFQHIIDLSPDHGDALLLDSLALCLSGDIEAAQISFGLVRSATPQVLEKYAEKIFLRLRGADHVELTALELVHLYERHSRCDWGEYSRLKERFAESIEISPVSLADPVFGFRALALGLSPALLNKLAGGIACYFNKPYLPRKDILPSGRLRVGYLSADFRVHPMGLLLQGLFERHDRDRFVVYAYSIFSSEDDEVRRAICAGVDRFVDLSLLDDEAASQRILDDQLDILIDLSGYTEHARPEILAYRPAAIQMSWLGYLAPISSHWIDYVILDSVVAPVEADWHWGEKILRLPQSLFFCSYVASLDVVARDEPSSILLAAPHHPRKLDPETFAIWMRLMRRCGECRLWLLADSRSAEKNLRDAAVSQGVDPSRLMITERTDLNSYRDLLAQADLFLDTPLYNGGATVCDAVAVGLPVLTLMGDSVTQRMAASILSAAGFVEGIVRSAEDYEQKALDWLLVPGALPALKQKLRDARETAPFFRLSEWVVEFEQVLQRVRKYHFEMGSSPPSEPLGGFTYSVPNGDTSG